MLYPFSVKIDGLAGSGGFIDSLKDLSDYHSLLGLCPERSTVDDGIIESVAFEILRVVGGAFKESYAAGAEIGLLDDLSAVLDVIQAETVVHIRAAPVTDKESGRLLGIRYIESPA